MRYFPNMLQMIHEIMLLQVCYCNLKFLMPLLCCHAVGLCSVITETRKTKKKSHAECLCLLGHAAVSLPQYFRRFGEL